MERQQVEAYVDAAAAALGLSIAAEHRPGVVHYVELAAEMAEQVMTLPMHIDDETAPAFVPIGPDDVASSEAIARP